MPQKARRLFFLVTVYVALPSLLILAGLVVWMAAIENATLVLQSADSPDGRYRAQVVREDPGASSNYEYMVRVAPASLTPLAEKLRLLPFGTRYTLLEVHHEPDKLDLQWTSPAELTIHCQGCAGAGLGKRRWRDLRLTYEVQ
jgi:hypothetical protein